MPTNNVITFDHAKRSEVEFMRHGATSWTRAIDEAQEIARALRHQDREMIAGRLVCLERRLANLQWRDADLDDLVTLSPGDGIELTVTLREAPTMLRMLAAA
ncbi:hypothetical protein [Sphingomonas alba]|uniref:Uncharacterized protein n=1 Tax=Sphingomonas alba TaxID=2908208 RepID=A0ABT0RP83_9SPHN|nr:hypothetical protein [Sphingomonas alba]MCL6684451.1 hypothetical protein [Sphingomonas alba]